MRNEYALNKLQTAIALLCLYGGTLLFFRDNVAALWASWLFIYMVTGYGHFLLGFGYQAGTLFRKTKEPWQNLAKIWGLSLLFTIPFAWLLVTPSNRTYIILFIIIYFLWHGALNEKTLYERVTDSKFQSVFHFVGGTALLLYASSLFHPSAIFDSDYHFDPSFDPRTIEAFMGQLHIPAISQFILLVVGLWGLFLFLKMLQQRDWFGLKWLGIITAIAVALFWIFEPINFILFLSLVLTYHFVMWWLYYARVFRQKVDQKAWYHYLGWSALVHGSLLLILGAGYYGWFESAGLTSVYEILFAIPLFLIVTFLHITTSFFNEEPVKSWLKIK